MDGKRAGEKRPQEQAAAAARRDTEESRDESWRVKQRMEGEEDITAKSVNFISGLPDLAQDHIFSYLGIRDKIRAAQVNSSLCGIVYRPCHWRQMKVKLDLKKQSEENLSSYKLRGIRDVIVLEDQPMLKVVSVIHDWPGLVSLNMRSFSLSFDDIQIVFTEKLESLRKLVVSVEVERPHESDERLPNLEDIEIGASCSSDAVPHEFDELFQHLPNLEDLEIDASRFRGAVEAISRHLKCLKHLALRATRITWEEINLESLVQLSTLQSLYLFDFQLPRTEFLKSSCKALKKLTIIDSCLYPDMWPEIISQILSLEELELTGCYTQPEDGLKQLSKGLKNLKVLKYCMDEQPVYDDDLEPVKDMSSLQELYLEHCIFTNGRGLKALRRHLQNLRSLGLSECKGLSAKAMKHIARMSSLRELKLEKSDIDGCSLQIINEASCQLRKLDLDNCPNIRSEDMKHVAEMSSLNELILCHLDLGSTGMSFLNQGTFKLKNLEIQGCRLTFRDLKPLLEKQVSLERLILSDCLETSDDQIEVQSLRKKLPFLKDISLMR